MQSWKKKSCKSIIKKVLWSIAFSAFATSVSYAQQGYTVVVGSNTYYQNNGYAYQNPTYSRSIRYQHHRVPTYPNNVQYPNPYAQGYSGVSGYSSGYYIPQNYSPSAFAPTYYPPVTSQPQQTRAQRQQQHTQQAALTPSRGSQNQYNLPAKFRRQMVDYHGEHKPGTIIVDTEERLLYLVKPGNKALRYGIGVARPGFEWAGFHKVTRKKKWPSWTPPAAMRKREPDLPKFMPGGPDNPMGARALYLGSTLYRIHGSNEPWTIGHNVSAGCIRMTNEDVIHLYKQVGVGAKVYVI